MDVDSELDRTYASPLTCEQKDAGEENMRNGINPTQALILGSLHSGDMSGAQIIAIGAQISGFWNSTRSQVYREMPGLEAKGYIKIIRDKIPTQYKEMYHLTAAGKKVYKKWKKINTPPDHLRNPWMLRYILSTQDGSDPIEVCKLAADYYRHARLKLELEGGEQVGAEALAGYYQLMEDWFLNQAR